MTEATVAGLAMPRPTGRRQTAWRPVGASKAVFALAPSTMLEANGSGPGSLKPLAGLARSVPCFELELGTDMAGVAGALAELLDACRP